MPKDWGTTGFVVNTKNDAAETRRAGRNSGTWPRTTLTGRVMVHDYQLTTIGNALKYFGYSFNSNDEKELAEAEKLLLAVKPHLFGINSDYQPSMRNGDAWMSMCWTSDAAQLHRDIPEMLYVLGKEGGEIWTDIYAIPKGAPNREAAYALIDYLLTPEINAKEVAGARLSLDRLPHQQAGAEGNAGKSHPLSGGGALSPLEFGAAATLTNPLRAEIMARFKSA